MLLKSTYYQLFVIRSFSNPHDFGEFLIYLFLSFFMRRKLSNSNNVALLVHLLILHLYFHRFFSINFFNLVEIIYSITRKNQTHLPSL